MMKRENGRLEEDEENQAGGNWKMRKNRQTVGGVGEWNWGQQEVEEDGV